MLRPDIVRLNRFMLAEAHLFSSLVAGARPNTDAAATPWNAIQAARLLLRLRELVDLLEDCASGKLDRIAVGDRVTVQLMGNPVVLNGRVRSVAAAISNRERSTPSDMLANVNPTFSWVRLAQRPVRVSLENVPEDVRLLMGRTVTAALS